MSLITPQARETRFFTMHKPQQPVQVQTYPTTTSAATTDINALLSMLNGGQQVSVPQPPPQPVQPMQPTGLEAIFAQFAGNNNPAPAPQPNPYDQSIQTALEIFNQQQNQAQAAYNPAPVVPPQTPDFSSILAQFTQQANPQPQAYNYQQMHQSENERKRQYDNGMQSSYDQYSDSTNNKRAKGNSGKKAVCHDLVELCSR